MLAIGATGFGALSAGLADFITVASYGDHAGGGIRPAPCDFVSAGPIAGIHQESTKHRSMS